MVKKRTRSKSKAQKPRPVATNAAASAPIAAMSTPQTALEEALEVRASVKARLDACEPSDMAKYVDAYSRAANVVRQLEKDRKRSLAAFTDDELVEYMRGLPERRRDALITAVQGIALAGKPLF